MDYWDLGLGFPLPLLAFEKTNQDVKLISGSGKVPRLLIAPLIRGSSEEGLMWGRNVCVTRRMHTLMV